MKQIVDKLNKIAKAIDENVELSDSDLIIDSLDSITKAFGGTPNNSNLIVDKLEDIAGVAHGGGGGGGSIENPVLTITFNNTLSGEAGKPYYYTIDNNQLIKMFKPLPGNTETVFNTLVPIYRSEDEEDYAGWQCDSLASVLGTITASNEVNCSLDYTADSVCRIWLDDPTEDASITLTITNR